MYLYTHGVSTLLFHGSENNNLVKRGKNLLYNLRADAILEVSMKLHIFYNPVAKTKK